MYKKNLTFYKKSVKVYTANGGAEKMQDFKRQARIILRNQKDFFFNEYQLSFLKKIVASKFQLSKKQIEYFENFKEQRIERILERIGKLEAEIDRLHQLVELIK